MNYVEKKIDTTFMIIQKAIKKIIICLFIYEKYLKVFLSFFRNKRTHKREKNRF